MQTTTDLPECLETLFDCNSTNATCRNSARFDFVSLWNITLQYSRRCPQGPWLFKQLGSNQTAAGDYVALTNDICNAITDLNWTKYPGADIWARLTTWKFPLFQLVANSPRPPLGFWVEAFSFVHFLGDPIGTITDILRKLDGCQTRAMFWQDHLDSGLVFLRNERNEQECQRFWKALTIIVDSFDEWGLKVGDRAEKYLLHTLSSLCSASSDGALRQQYIGVCLQTADALAADRSTKFVPVVIAQAFFIGTIAIAMIRTESTSQGPLPTSYINIEMYSIAFTAQYFWVIFAVVWSSIIGTSQTARAIPRILRRFNWDLGRTVSSHGMTIDLPIDDLEEEIRRHSGGIYTWLPSRPRTFVAHNSTLEHRVRRDQSYTTTKLQSFTLATILRIWPLVHAVLPFCIVATAAGTGQLLSALVPPTGWSCRSEGMMWMFVTWVASYITSLVPFRNHYRSQFWFTLVKDLLVVGVTFGIVVKTQFGVYNRCDCYTQNGHIGLQLPFMPAVDGILRSRLSNVYPAVVAVGITIQLVLVPILLIWRYHAAVQVFLQRDDGQSNLDWLYFTLAWIRDKALRRAPNRYKACGTESVLRSTSAEKTQSTALIQEID